MSSARSLRIIVPGHVSRTAAAGGVAVTGQVGSREGDWVVVVGALTDVSWRRGSVGCYGKGEVEGVICCFVEVEGEVEMRYKKRLER